MNSFNLAFRSMIKKTPVVSRFFYRYASHIAVFYYVEICYMMLRSALFVSPYVSVACGMVLYIALTIIIVGVRLNRVWAVAAILIIIDLHLAYVITSFVMFYYIGVGSTPESIFLMRAIFFPVECFLSVSIFKVWRTD